MKINLEDWLWGEAEEPNPMQQLGNQQIVDPQAGNPAVNQPMPEDDVEEDPTDPDIEEEETPKDFEEWRHEFFELSIKGDIKEMLDSIAQVKQTKITESSQKKFVEDNLQILLYRQDANISKATKEIRNLISDDLDRTNPGTTIMQHVTAILEKDQTINQVLLKLTGLYGLKGDLHRKWLAALLGAVQVGGGGNREDLLYSDTEYTINISTRFHTQFGEVTLGKWSLKSDDPERYLSEPEMDRLSEGSPEEKQVLRRRVILESISEKFKKRAFLIHIVHPDGTINSLGWDLGDSLLAAYREGKLVVRGRQNEEKDAMISDNGEIVTLIDLDILYVKETGESDDNGRPQMVEVPFMERRDSVLYLVADLETLNMAASSMSGIFFREVPYTGNPSDVDAISQCIPSVYEILNRKCV